MVGAVEGPCLIHWQILRSRELEYFADGRFPLLLVYQPYVKIEQSEWEKRVRALIQWAKTKEMPSSGP